MHSRRYVRIARTAVAFIQYSRTAQGLPLVQVMLVLIAAGRTSRIYEYLYTRVRNMKELNARPHQPLLFLCTEGAREDRPAIQ